MWGKEYKNKNFYWGLKPNPILKKFLTLIPKGTVLDIGAGEGRNSIFLSKHGFQVEAIDKIAEGLKKCKILAQKNNLSIKTKVCDIRNFEFVQNKYSLVLASASLDFLKKSEIEKIIKQIKISLVKNGFIYLSVFSTKDPMYKKIKQKKLKEVEKNTFYLSKHKTYRHFFTKSEIQQILSDFKFLYFKQRKIKDNTHGLPHFHSIIEVLGQKQ